MNLINKVSIALFLSITLSAGADEHVTSIEIGNVNGEDVQVVLDEETMRKTPSWDVSGASVIPLTPNAAVAAAVGYLKKALVQKPFGGFIVSEVSLKRYSEHRYYYIVHFERDFQPTGIHRSIKVVVTLDGVVVPFQKYKK